MIYRLAKWLAARSDTLYATDDTRKLRAIARHYRDAYAAASDQLSATLRERDELAAQVRDERIRADTLDEQVTVLKSTVEFCESRAAAAESAIFRWQSEFERGRHHAEKL